MLQAINPPGFSIPGISQAMLVEGGRPLILSGHVPFDAKGKLSGRRPGVAARPSLPEHRRNVAGGGKRLHFDCSPHVLCSRLRTVHAADNPAHPRSVDQPGEAASKRAYRSGVAIPAWCPG